MDIIDARVKYKPNSRYLIPSIITHREILSEDFIHELGKVYLSIYLSIYPQIADFSGIGKEIGIVGKFVLLRITHTFCVFPCLLVSETVSLRALAKIPKNSQEIASSLRSSQ